MDAKNKWVVSASWDVASYAEPPKLVCLHIHDDETEHACDISPMTELCERSLIAGKCRPGTVIKCLTCKGQMSENDEIIFRL